jgi:hypothetical protein
MRLQSHACDKYLPFILCVSALTVFFHQFFVAMPGSSMIFGLLPCTNGRTVFVDKPLTCDADVVIAVVEDVVTVTTALLTHFCAAEEPPFEDGAMYIVEGKVASLDKSFAVGENFNVDEYDFLIEAQQVCVHLSFFPFPNK